MGFFKKLLIVGSGPAGWVAAAAMNSENENEKKAAVKQGREEGFKDGVKKGVAEANKKFAKMQNR